jgi:hypothetical protein
MRTISLALVLVAAAGNGRVASARDEAPVEEQVPSGVWKLEVRDRVDGELQGEARSVPLRFRVIRNRVSGHPADDEPDRARLTGEVVVGKATVVTWRQDNSNIEGYSSFCTGRVVENGKIVGTWHDTEGQSGDFVLSFQKKQPSP